MCNMKSTRRDFKAKHRVLLSIFRNGILTTVPSTRLNSTVYIRYCFHSVKSKIKREHIGIVWRIGLLLLPSLSIHFAELSLSSLLHSPVIIPSPIGMELFDVCSTMLYSSFTVSPRDKAYRRRDRQRFENLDTCVCNVASRRSR